MLIVEIPEGLENKSRVTKHLVSFYSDFYKHEKIDLEKYAILIECPRLFEDAVSKKYQLWGLDLKFQSVREFGNVVAKTLPIPQMDQISVHITFNREFLNRVGPRLKPWGINLFNWLLYHEGYHSVIEIMNFESLSMNSFRDRFLRRNIAANTTKSFSDIFFDEFQAEFLTARFVLESFREFSIDVLARRCEELTRGFLYSIERTERILGELRTSFLEQSIQESECRGQVVRFFGQFLSIAAQLFACKSVVVNSNILDYLQRNTLFVRDQSAWELLERIMRGIPAEKIINQEEFIKNELEDVWRSLLSARRARINNLEGQEGLAWL